jgi:AcrR family transcriptional regulator
LLAAATLAFAENGYHATKISDIVARSSLTQAAFYLYFPSKDAIFEELVRLFREQIAQFVQDGHIPAGLSLDEAARHLHDHIQAVYRLLAADLNLTRIALIESPQAEAIRRELAAMLVQNLTREQAAGYLRDDISVDIAAEFIIGTVERATIRWILSGEKTVEQLVTETVAFILDGLFKR